MERVFRAIFAACGICALAGAATSPVNADPGVWHRFAEAGDPYPPSMDHFPHVYDSSRNRMLVYNGTLYALDFDDESWSIVPAANAPAVSGISIIYDAANDRLVLYGGQSGSVFNDNVYVLNLTGAASWSLLTVTNAPPPSRYRHTAIYDPEQQRMIVWGGTGVPPNSWPLDDTWELTLGAMPTWALRTTYPTPAPRNDPACTYDPVQHRMLLFGGQYYSTYGDMWALDLNTMLWHSIGTGPSPRQGASAVFDAARNQMILFGGAGYALSSEVWTMRDDGILTWTLAGNGAVPGCYGHGAEYDPLRARMVVFGGIGNNSGWPLNYSETRELTLTPSAQWRSLFAPLPPSQRHAAAVLDAAGRRMLMFGGRDANGSANALTWQLDLDGDATWTFLPTPSAPVAREGHAAAWDAGRQRMWVFGGTRSNHSLLNETHALDMSGSPQWDAAHTTGRPPSARERHTMIYDPLRDRLLVFGGKDVINRNDLYALPLSGATALRWETISPLGSPPAPRSGATMVYDAARDRALLFGGTGSAYFNDVWALDLAGATPQWLPLATAGGAPIERSEFAMTLDESADRLLVFGGVTTSGWLADSWELSLGAATPTWRQLTPAGTPPAARAAMAAVFDPVLDRMMLHGGEAEMVFGDTWFLDLNGTTGVEATAVALDRPRITQVAPNPSAGSVIIGFALQQMQRTRVELIDLSGRRMRDRDLGVLGAGSHSVRMQWDGVRPGVYWLRLGQAGAFSTRKVMVMR